MPPRKAAKRPGVTTSRETFPSSDEEGHDDRATEWIKLTTRTVHTDVQATSRNRKTTRFTEEDEEVEVVMTPLDIFSDSVQNEHFSAWLNSCDQDNNLDDYGDYGDYVEHNTAAQPSGGNSNPIPDNASDTSSVDSKDDVDSPVHDLSEFAVEQAKTKILLEWIPLRDSLLDELTRLDGVKDQRECADCGGSFDKDEDRLLRCSDCLDSEYRCKECMLVVHADKPLHRIYVWKGFWDKVELIDLGLTYDVGHGGKTCPSADPRAQPCTLSIISTNGFHRVNVRWCSCSRSLGKSSEHWVQLTRMRWFPATHKKPKTAITFDCLDLFHKLTLQGKLTGHDYYESLLHLTDNTNFDPPRKRYEEFMRVARLWRHLKLLKRAGIGLEPEGVASAQPGSCAIRCPACPDPTVAPRPDVCDPGIGEDIKDKTWLDSLFLMMDANFRLKSKDRGIKTDPALGSGLAYYVEEEKYQEYISTCSDQTEVNYCDSGLHAVDHANTRGGDLYNASGVGACQCRHMLMRKLGVADLQKGERYANMDYIFWSTLYGYEGTPITVSYDIVCQWHINLLSRFADLPDDLRDDIDRFIIKFVIPKFHISAHGDKCQSIFSLNLRRRMARTDGENIERGWAHMNPASLSTREMGPGARRDTLDCQWSGWNWRLLVRLGGSLLRRLYESVAEARVHREHHIEFSKTFSDDNIAEWTEMVRVWNDNPKQSPNPYEEPVLSTTLADVKRELNKEEDEELTKGVLPLHQISASLFLATGLELEEQQRVLANSYKNARAKKNNSRTFNIDKKDRDVRRKIILWRNIQQIYMPCATAVRASNATKRAARLARQPVTPQHVVSAIRVAPEIASYNFNDVDDANESAVDMDLCLPSSLPDNLRNDPALAPLVEKERRLRLPQCREALASLRRRLRICARLFDSKKLHTAGTGTRPNTRMQALLDKHALYRERDVERYRAARNALVLLDPQGAWQQSLKPLLQQDVHPPIRGQEETAKGRAKGKRSRKGTAWESEGRRTLSWIWRAIPQVHGAGDDVAAAKELEDGLRVEWAKSLARAERWEEEILLLREEMRRTLVVLDHQAQVWRTRGALRDNCELVLASGLRGYAEKQAIIRERLANDFATIWLAGLKESGLASPVTWPAKYIQANPTSKKVVRRPQQNKLRARVVAYVEGGDPEPQQALSSLE